MSTTVYFAGDTDSEDPAVPFSNLQAARDWCVLQLEFIEEVDTAEMSFSFAAREGDTSGLEFLVVNELLGKPESWKDATPEYFSWSFYVRPGKVYDSTEEASQDFVPIALPNMFEEGEYQT